MKAMSRQSAVYDHFTEDGDQFTCSILKCGVQVAKLKTGSTASNLKRHLQRKHIDVFEEVEEEDRRVKKPKLISSTSGSKLITNYFHPSNKKASTTVTQDDFRDAILKMVVYDGVSLSFFKGGGFQTIAGSLAKNLDVPLGRDAVRTLVIERSEEEKKKLQARLKDKIIFLKFDGVTRLRSHFLGVSAQFWDESEGLTNRTLSIIDSTAKFDSRSTKEMVIDTLNRFNIPKRNVLGCVVDNASTMTKTLELLNEEEAIEDEPEEDPEGDESEPIFHGQEIYHMRCAEHTLQLGIRDALKRPVISNVLAKIRAIAAFLRAPHADAILKKRTGKGMIIDMPTRWGSTYSMISRLLELKEIVQDFVASQVHLTDREWQELEGLKEILGIPHKTTLSLQKEAITPGECLYEWRQAIFQLERSDGTLADEIARCLRERERSLMNVEPFVAAIWVDARYRLLLTAEERERAKQTLRRISTRINESASSTSVSLSSVQDNPEPSEAHSQSDFDVYLDTLEGAQAIHDKSNHDFDHCLNEVEKLGRVKADSVWHIIEQYPSDFQKVSRLLSSLPCTQVSVERVFSHLKLVLRDNRSRMSEDLVDAILFLRTNNMI